MINYSYERIVQILKNDYHLKLQIIIDYKGNRWGHISRYNLLDENNELVLSNITLDALRLFLEGANYPLKDTQSKDGK